MVDVEWAVDGEGAAVEDVGVDFGGADVLGAEELLNGFDIVTASRAPERLGTFLAPRSVALLLRGHRLRAREA